MLHRTMAAMGVVAVLACTAVLHAQEDNAYMERYTFVAANAPPDALTKDGRLHLAIKRYSTDEERRMMEKAVVEPARLLDAFRNVGAIGYLQWPGGLEYTVRYAQRASRPDGGADIVIVVERPLWLWWDSKATWSSQRPYTVVHLTIDKDGKGVGRVSIGTDVKADASTGIALADLTQPPLLTDVRRAS